MLRQRSRMASDSPEFWSREQEASLPVDSVPNAAVLVAAGQADPFHHCISGVVAAGVELPALGVFVWPDAIELDYRMGREWGPAQVAGFFELLRDCCTADPVRSFGRPTRRGHHTRICFDGHGPCIMNGGRA